MLKLILADDEFLVREGLRDIISWNEYGIHVIGEAVDGQQAFDLCMKFRPDILLTDIRMPFMGGLEVALKLKENGLDTKIIIFSGVQDFDYAKTALNINAEAYILKPLEVEELKAVVKRVVNKIHQERDREQTFQNLRQLLYENINTAKEKILRNLVLGVYKNKKDIMEKLEYFDYPFMPEEPISVSVLEIDEYSAVTGNMNEEDKQLLAFSITNIADELINNHTKGISFGKDENEVVLLFNRHELTKERYNAIFQEINSCLLKYLQISVSIGIGHIADSVSDVNSAYMSAVDALQYKFYAGKGSIIYFSDIAAGQEINDQIGLFDIQLKISRLIKLGDLFGVETVINELFNKLVANRSYAIEGIQGICAEVIFSATRLVYETGDEFIEIAGSRELILEEINKSESIYILKDILSGVLSKIAGHYAKKYAQKKNKIILEIKKIVDKEYMKNINVVYISDMVYLTPNYISLIFKQETNETITDYITKVRMEKAKELLKSLDLKVLEIAEMVGYNDASYFSKVFKKYVGVYPRKYRRFISNY